MHSICKNPEDVCAPALDQEEQEGSSTVSQRKGRGGGRQKSHLEVKQSRTSWVLAMTLVFTLSEMERH